MCKPIALVVVVPPSGDPCKLCTGLGKVSVFLWEFPKIGDPNIVP